MNRAAQTAPMTVRRKTRTSQLCRLDHHKLQLNGQRVQNNKHQTRLHQVISPVAKKTHMTMTMSHNIQTCSPQTCKCHHSAPQQLRRSQQPLKGSNFGQKQLRKHTLKARQVAPHQPSRVAMCIKTKRAIVQMSSSHLATAHHRSLQPSSSHHVFPRSSAGLRTMGIHTCPHTCTHK
jgi:hypothetical protein